MISAFILNVICPFAGTVAFAALFSVPRRFYISCGFTGLAGWLMYTFVYQYATIAVASFAGAFVVVLLSRILTVRKRCPITVFLISGIFPLIPGAGVYNTAYYLVTNQLQKAAWTGIQALKIAVAIVIGIVFVVSIPRELFRVEYWRRKIQRRSSQPKESN